MNRFAALYQAIDSTTSTSEKRDALTNYLSSSSPADAAWATYFLCGYKLRQLVPTKKLRMWAAEEANVPAWLFEESYHAVGDLAETLALIIPSGTSDEDISLSVWVEQRLIPLRAMNDADQHDAVRQLWRQSQSPTRLVILKLITGAFRVGVSKATVTQALAEHASVPPDVISHRLMGTWEPTPAFLERLISKELKEAMISQPYPFCLAHSIDRDLGPASLGDAKDFAAEWKWDGIRGQVIHRDRQVFLWSRSNSAFVTWTQLQAFKGDLHHEARCNAPHRTKRLLSILTNEAVDRLEFCIIKTTVCLGKWHKRAAIPDSKRIIRIEPRSLSMSLLRINQHCIDCKGGHFPFPPHASGPPHFIPRIQAFQHQSFRIHFTTLVLNLCPLLPRLPLERLRDAHVRMLDGRQ